MAVDIKRKGMLLIISGPSGAGKGTLEKMLMACDPSFSFSCSVTTRQPRRSEREGIDYYFTDDARYDELLAQGAFLEHATVHGHRYGTLKQPIDDMLSKGRNVLLDIDQQGAINVMNTTEDYVSVFILPPSFEELRVRLHSRNTDKEAEIERRLANAQLEILKADRFQYAIINENLELAFSQLHAIVTAEKQRTTRFAATVY